MSALFELAERPDLESPVLVVVLEGWVDAGLGAANAVGALLGSLDTATIATFDTDELLDHRARRPVMHLVNGVNASLSWPKIELRATSDRAGNDMLLLVGAEPDHRWRAFTHAVVDIALEFGARMTVGLGAYPAPVPHTRPVRLAAASATAELIAADFMRATLDVPSGVQGAIERRSADVGLPAIGLWAQVPHYAAGMPYPAASAALVEGLGRLAALDLDASALHEQAAVTRGRIDELIRDNAEHQQMVRLLEAQSDATDDEADESGAMPLSEEKMPSADELGAEFERFLRDQGP